MTTLASASDKPHPRTSFSRFGQALRCWLFGHQDLASADAYGERLPDSHDELELLYCGACGRPVWIRSRPSPALPHWQALHENDEGAAGVF